MNKPRPPDTGRGEAGVLVKAAHTRLLSRVVVVRSRGPLLAEPGPLGSIPSAVEHQQNEQGVLDAPSSPVPGTHLSERTQRPGYAAVRPSSKNRGNVRGNGAPPCKPRMSCSDNAGAILRGSRALASLSRRDRNRLSTTRDQIRRRVAFSCPAAVQRSSNRHRHHGRMRPEVTRMVTSISI